LIFINLLKNIVLLMALSLATTQAQAASALALQRFSVSHTHGYPQEWWISEFSALPVCCV